MIIKPTSALVTGATSGLGYELAKALYPHVERLIITGRDENRLKMVQQELRALMPSRSENDVVAIVYDFLLPLKGGALFELLQHEVPDILINNAGFGWYGLFSQEPFVEQARIMEVDYIRTIEITYEWLKKVRSMSNRKYRLCFISSIAAFMPIPGMASYAAVKAALLSFAEALRLEIAVERLPVSVLTVCPGAFKTGFQQVAAHKKISEGDLQSTTSNEAALLAEKIVSQILEDREGVYIPPQWWWQYIGMRFLPKKILQRPILKRLLSRI